MNWRGHVAVGAITTGILLAISIYLGIISPIKGFIQWAFIALIVFIYSQIPDIDADISKINKLWNTAAGMVIIYASWFRSDFIWNIVATVAAGSIIMLEWVKHRGITHTLYFAILMSIPLFFVGLEYGLAAISGASSHLFADGVIIRKRNNT